MTGFLGKGLHTGAITTLGRGGSDLSATVLGAALELDEVQVWKDVDGEGNKGKKGFMAGYMDGGHIHEPGRVQGTGSAVCR